eukprot:9133602-Alexandrium_andersonii.AAC.1
MGRLAPQVPGDQAGRGVLGPLWGPLGQRRTLALGCGAGKAQRREELFQCQLEARGEEPQGQRPRRGACLPATAELGPPGTVARGRRRPAARRP